MDVYVYLQGAARREEYEAKARLICEQAGMQIAAVAMETDKIGVQVLRQVLSKIEPGDWLFCDTFRLLDELVPLVYPAAVHTCLIFDVYGRENVREALTRSDRHNAAKMRSRFYRGEKGINGERQSKADAAATALILAATEIAEEHGLRSQAAVAVKLVERGGFGTDPATVRRNLSNAIKRVPDDLRREWASATAEWAGSKSA